MQTAPHSILTGLLGALLAGCAVGTDAAEGMAPLVPDGTVPDCEARTYPDGAVEPMALGEVLSPYSWPVAIHRGTGETAELDLGTVPCAASDDIDWSPHDVLLFVSIPAW